MKTILLIIFAILFPASVWAAENGQSTGLPLPRFVSLKFSETNLRKGPGAKYPIVWVYKVKGYPLEVTAEFESWRRLRDIDGNEGWVHENLITGSRNAVINSANYLTPRSETEGRDRELILFRYPDENSYPMARAEMGVIVKVKSCEKQWCKLKIEDITAWARKTNLWGIYAEEIIK